MSNDDEALDADNPFDAFGAERSDGGEDSGDSDADAVVLQQSSQPRYREAHNGVLAFHRGTEQALVLFVRQQLQESKLSNKSSSSDATSDANTASASLDHNDNNNNSRQEILSAVDKFCVERHWMMHVGPDKGLVLQDFLGEKVMLSLLSPASARRPFVVVELGTYCGYSTIRMADTMLRISGKKGNNNFDFHIFTVDVNPQSQAVAKQLVALAGLSDHVSFVLLPQLPSASYNSETTTALADELRSAMKKNGCDDDDDNFKIDFLFVDHAKELYLSDVQQLESSGFIRRGTAVAADNVVFFELEDYRQHMARLQAIGVVTTRLVSDGLFLEYVSSSKDAELRHANDPNLNGPPNPETELRDGLGTFCPHRRRQLLFADHQSPLKLSTVFRSCSFGRSHNLSSFPFLFQNLRNMLRTHHNPKNRAWFYGPSLRPRLHSHTRLSFFFVCMSISR